MDPVISVTQSTSDPISRQLREQHCQEMDDLIADYARQIAEITQSREAAISETARITEERDAAKAARDAGIQRNKEAQEALENTMAELKQAKRKHQEEKKTWEEERSKLERRSKTFKDKLALTTPSMEKRLGQAEQRAEDEHMDKKELKRLNEELIERNHRDKRNASEAKASHEQWRRKYSTALAEKIDLLHQHAPNPVFPIEVLVNIAGFVAGANDYAGVAAMCATSRLMNAEIKPVLFETLIWTDSKQTRLQQLLKSNVAEFPYTRFIFLDDRQTASFDTYKNKAFPKLRVIIRKAPLVHSSPSPPEYSASLYIMRNTTLKTLVSILRHPLQWGCEGNLFLRSCVRGISCIQVGSCATLVTEDCATDGLIEPSRNLSARVDILKNMHQSAGQSQLERITTSLEAIRRIFMSPGSTTALYKVEFLIRDPQPAELEVWIVQIREWVVVKPEMLVTVWVTNDDPDTSDFAIASRFRVMYEGLWQGDARFNKPEIHPTDISPFFLLATGPTLSENTFGAYLTRRPGLNGFTINIERYTDNVDGDDFDVEILFEGHYALDGAVWPPANENGDGDASDSDGDPPRDMSPDRGSTGGRDVD